jgi:hypothetical protein
MSFDLSGAALGLATADASGAAASRALTQASKASTRVMA